LQQQQNRAKSVEIARYSLKMHQHHQKQFVNNLNYLNFNNDNVPSVHRPVSVATSFWFFFHFPPKAFFMFEAAAAAK
jgi:hypothetical protein